MRLEAAIAQAFRLGAVRGQLVWAAAGWGGHNTVARLVTSAGTWAVKRYGWGSPVDVTAESAFAIESAAHERGVPMARPIPTTESHGWAEIEGHAYRCHEWIVGKAKANEETSVGDAGLMGAVVAHLHGLKLPCPPEPTDAPDKQIRWEDLAAAGRFRRAPWAARLSDASETFGEIGGIPGAGVAEDEETVGSHRDLNAHNVLAFLRGYVDGGGTVEADDPEALGRSSAALLPWVAQNVRLAVDRPTFRQDELAGPLIDALLAMPRTIALRQALLAEALARL